jgi:ornithine cyclodeaminase/alanine dehydrogenase
VSSGTLILRRQDIAGLLSFADYVDACRDVFRAHATGNVIAPALMHLDTDAGEFHIKGGGIRGARTFVAVKVNGGFFQNPARFNMPAIQGSIVLCDGDNGAPLAYMDSSEITINRTGATTAVAAAALARPDSRTVTICGCGRQGRIQLIGIRHALPGVDRVFAYDVNAEAARLFAANMSRELSIDVTAVDTVGEGAPESDVIVTCTPSRKPFLLAEHVRPGAFVAAVGADSPDKQELDPRVLAQAAVITDITGQCEHVGELHHAIAAGLMSASDVRAQLGEIVSGSVAGRLNAGERIVFDTTGTALQDAAAAAAVYERAVARGVGQYVQL